MHTTALPKHGEGRQIGGRKRPAQRKVDCKNIRTRSKESAEALATIRWTSPAPYQIKGRDGQIFSDRDFCRRLQLTAGLVTFSAGKSKAFLRNGVARACGSDLRIGSIADSVSRLSEAASQKNFLDDLARCGASKAAWRYARSFSKIFGARPKLHSFEKSVSAAA